MMLEEIKFSEDLKIYTTKLVGIDNKLLANDLELNCDVSRETSNYTKNNPGIQSEIILTSNNINKLNHNILEILKKFLKLNDDYIFFSHRWVYISEKKNNFSVYHTHDGIGNIEVSKEIPQWSVVYYVGMPDNLLGNDGKLFFKNSNNDEFSILPIESQLILFKSNVPHKAELNKNSDKKRIVYAMNIAIIDRNKQYVKKQKTLM